MEVVQGWWNRLMDKWIDEADARLGVQPSGCSDAHILFA